MRRLREIVQKCVTDKYSMLSGWLSGLLSSRLLSLLAAARIRLHPRSPQVARNAKLEENSAPVCKAQVQMAVEIAVKTAGKIACNYPTLPHPNVFSRGTRCKG